jgi:hypothetical protein
MEQRNERHRRELDRTHNEILGCDEELEAAAEGKCAWLMPTASFDAPCC